MEVEAAKLENWLLLYLLMLLVVAEEKKNIDYLGPLYVAIFDLQNAEREMPDLKEKKEFQSAKDLLRNAFDKIKAFHERQCPI